VNVLERQGVGGSASGTGAAAGGRDAILHDAARGETAGALRLFQRAEAGAGGDAAASAGGAAGRAESTLALLGASGSLSLDAEAQGGAGGDGSVGADGGEGFASAVGSAAGDVRIRAAAYGGFGGRGLSGPTGAAGTARLGQVFGRSEGGGDVTVIGEITGGANAEWRGADAILIDAVDGETTGALRLEQRALTSFALPGRAGLARSELRQHRDVASLALVCEAEGAAATALSEATNDGGAASAVSYAAGATGENANAEARATSSADGAAVSVGLAPLEPTFWNSNRFPRSGAYGGQPGAGLMAGSATSLSAGTHTGDGAVTVHDYAVAGFQDDFSDGLLDGAAASSTALAANAGASRVEAWANAYGGSSARRSPAPPPGTQGGDGEAFASAQGGGEAFAHAFARGGFGAAGSEGVGRARSLATGASGAATAEASVHGRLDAFSLPTADTLRVSATAQIAGGSALAEAAAGGGSLPPGALALAAGEGTPPPDAFAHAAQSLSTGALAGALAGNAAATEVFGRNAEEILGLVEVGGGGGSRDIVLGTAATFTESFLDVSVGEDLIVGFLDPELQGIASLRIQVVLSSGTSASTVLDLHFTDGDSAEAFLDDTVLSFDVLSGYAASIRVDMETRAGGPLATLDFLVATAVPEPRTLLLIGAAGLGLWLAAQRKRSRPGARGGRLASRRHSLPGA
jgi:hypothetical protein